MRSHWITAFVLSAANLALFCAARAVGDVEHSTPDQGAVEIDRDSIPCWRVGQFFIIGNWEVPDSIILEQCPLFCGAPASIADLGEAEENLARLGLFVVDRKRGIRPIVKILESDDRERRFFDVEITMEEKPNAKQLLAIRECLRFSTDWRTWGPCAAVYGAEGFPREILDLITEGNIRGIAGIISDKFSTAEKGRTGYAPPPAVLP